ncbi:MAG: hypothetical protein OXN94_07700 [Chloroflexota bacterium]|nr:hypothetical protein [Chloroflexota bacterium]
MDVLTTLFLMIITGVLIPPIRKLLDLVYRRCLLQIRKINEERNRRTQNKNNAEKAVRNALNSWDFAEKHREEKTEYVQAYGGYYPTVLEEIACWEDAVVKCKKAVTALELSNENDRARDFSRNVSIASKRIEALSSRSNEDNTRILVIGIDEAKKREYDAKMAKHNNYNLDRI